MVKIVSIFVVNIVIIRNVIDLMEFVLLVVYMDFMDKNVIKVYM